MTFEEYVSRRLKPVRLLLTMLNKELQYSGDEQIVMSRDELENIIDTLEIFFEEYAHASKQAKSSRRAPVAEVPAYPAEKKPALKSVA